MIKERSPSSPSVSVIIPVYNDPDGIRVTLNSIICQGSGRYDVFPVDNDSTDSTQSVIEEFSSLERERVFPLIESEKKSSYAARNKGIECSKGDVLLFLDADMWVRRSWIEDMIKALLSNGYDYLGCNVDVVTDDSANFWERYEQSFSFPVETYLEDKHFVPTCALAVRREVFKNVGLFDERLESGGDKEFGQRVHRAGFKQGYAEGVTAYHPERDSWKALRSKALRIGRGRAERRRYHPELGDTHPLHPINYLPPKPLQLRRRFSGPDASLPLLFGFYFIEYVLKLTQSYGMLRETLTKRRAKREES